MKNPVVTIDSRAARQIAGMLRGYMALLTTTEFKGGDSQHLAELTLIRDEMKDAKQLRETLLEKVNA